MRQTYSEYERKLLAMIDQHGWQFTYVFDPQGAQPSFGYSVGFSQSLEAPEFIVFGLPKDLTSAMLWKVYRQIKAGAQPRDGMIWGGVLDGFQCVSRKAVRKDLYTDYVISANWLWREHNKSGAPPVFQLIWPGAQQGLFPWDDGCVQEVIDAQPALWLHE